LTAPPAAIVPAALMFTAADPAWPMISAPPVVSMLVVGPVVPITLINALPPAELPATNEPDTFNRPAPYTKTEPWPASPIVALPLTFILAWLRSISAVAPV
jgi:hypothetical protein